MPNQAPTLKNGRRAKKESLVAKSEAIYQTMVEERLTLKEMGERLGVSRQRVSQILALTGKPSPTTWTRVRRGWRDCLTACPYCGKQYVNLKGAVTTADAEDAGFIEEAAAEGYAWGILNHSHEEKHPVPFKRAYLHLSKAIAEAYADGMGVPDIMEKFGLRWQTDVYRHLERWGVKPRYEKGMNPKIHPLRGNRKLQQQIAEEYKTTAGRELAEKYGVSSTRIHQVAKQYGVKAPPGRLGWNAYWTKKKEAQRVLNQEAAKSSTSR